MNTKNGWLVHATLCSVCLALTQQLNAQVTTDGTVGPAVTLAGPNIEIPQNLGALRGDNLFHSFQTFDVPASAIATFTGSDEITSVISRVTGGTPSDIQGTLGSTIGNASFYFINPAGVVLGANSSVDVPASFHLGTAQQIRFSDGTLFQADTATASTLSIASPEAFGFTGSGQAAIAMQGAQLSFAPGSRVLLAGNQLTMQDSGLQVVNEQATLVATGEIISGEITTIGFGDDPSGAVGGELIIEDSSIISFGSGPAAIAIHGGDVQVSGSAVQQVNLTDADSNGAITISADGLLVQNDTTVQTTTVGPGSGASLQVETGQLSISGDSQLTAGTAASGKGGSISVTTSGQLTISDGGQIRVESSADGEAGTVLVNTGSLSMTAAESQTDTGIFSTLGGNGSGGNVMINTDGEIRIDDNGYIEARSNANAQPANISVRAGQLSISGNQLEGVSAGISNFATDIGASGDIEVEVSGELSITDAGSISTSAGSVGNSGSITVQADQIVIESFGFGSLTGVFSSAEGVGDGGDVSVSANGQLSMTGGALIANTERTGQNQGDSGTVFINAARLLIVADDDSLPAGVFSEATSTGDGGDIVIEASEEVILRNGGRINAVTVASGNAGTITMNTGQLLIDGFSSISTASRNAEAGTGGEIDIRVGSQLTILNGGEIDDNTISNSDAGSITISAEQLLIDSQAGISSSTFGSGKAGNVEIVIAELATLQNGGQISTDSSDFAEGDAGNVQLTAGELHIDRQDSDSITGITSDTFGPGDAGSVELMIAQRATIQNGGQISSNTSAGGDAGFVRLTAGELLIDRQGSENVITGISSSTEGSGNAGSLEVTIADTATIQNAGEILSSTFAEGDAGQVVLRAGQLLIDGQGSPIVTGISSDTFASGNAGSVEVTIEEVATMQGGGDISSETFGAGDAGFVRLTAGRLLIDGQDSELFTGISSSTFDTGQAGSVELVIAESASLQSGGRISTATSGAGDAGNVQLTTGQLLIEGGEDSGDISGIFSNTFGGGNAGRVELTVAGAARIQNGGRISTGTSGIPNAGEVQLTAGELTIAGEGLRSGRISSGTSGAGNAGSVVVNIAGAASLQNEAYISSDSSGEGNAGVVQLTAGQLSIDGRGNTLDSDTITSITGISSQSFGIDAQTTPGNAGSVEVLVDGNIELIDGQISSAAFGGTAGSVRVTANRLVVEGDGRDINVVPGIFTSSNGRQAGPVMVSAESLILRNSQISTSTGSNILDGGSVSIVSEVMVLDSALIQANANSGQGGQIEIDSAYIGSENQVAIGGAERADFRFDGTNVIQAVAPSGVSVPPTINAPDIDVSGSLTELNATFDVAADLAFDPCAAFVAGAPSTLSLAGKGGMPADSVSALPLDLFNEQSTQFRQDSRTGNTAKTRAGTIAEGPSNYILASNTMPHAIGAPCEKTVE